MTEFEMKQNDWIEACKEIDILKEQNKIMRETLETINNHDKFLGRPTKLIDEALEKCSPIKEKE